MSIAKVPQGELQVLQVLWKQPKCTAKQVAESLGDEGKELSVSSVQTLLRRLESRGLVVRHQVGKSFEYSSIEAPKKVRAAHARDLLDRMFGGAISGFVTQLMDEEDVSDDELRELRALVDSKLKERKRK